MRRNYKLRVALVVGARPNFMKAAPLLIQAKKFPEIKFTLIHTDQHYDYKMSKVFFDELGIPEPDIHLGVKSDFHSEKLGRMAKALEKAFREQKTDLVMVLGDTNSTLAGAIGASAVGQKVAHVEAGLRSYDRRMPEEINRVVVDHLSCLLLTSEKSGEEHLVAEGVSPTKIKFVGNLMIENLINSLPKIKQYEIVSQKKLLNKEYVVTTIHRQENVDDPKILNRILKTLKDVSMNIKIVMPLHPGTRKKIIDFGFTKYLKYFTCLDPLGYFEFIKLVKCSAGVITDSGGIQEETSYLGITCCTIRDNTERPVTLTQGTNKLFPLVNLNTESLLAHINNKNGRKSPLIPFWDAGVSLRIFNELQKLY